MPPGPRYEGFDVLMDVAALQRQLDSRGSPLTLQASDATLPPELTAFLGTARKTAVTLFPVADGIVLWGRTLTVTGTATETWPIAGLTLTGIVLTITDGTPPVLELRATGTLLLGETKAPVG